MALRLKKIIIGNIIIIFLIIIKFLLIIISRNQYELILCGLTIWEIESVLFRMLLILVSTLVVFRQFEKRRKNIIKALSFLIAVIFVLCSFKFVAIFNELFYRNVNFYEVKITGEQYDKPIIAKEYSTIFGTTGILYKKITP